LCLAASRLEGFLMYALSLKQPWAALLVHGRKTIEVRRWPTARRGRVLIHAARVPDERPEAWGLVPPELRDAAELRGGIVGAGDLIDCRVYHDRKAFAADQAAHLNHSSWFGGVVLYGFTFANPVVLPFRPCPGWMRFFPVDQEGTDLPSHPSLLVSVRSAEEAEAALAGGAGLVDIKEPARGALGQASHEVIQAVVRAVAGGRPVSAALGELLDENVPPPEPALSYVKWGLAGCGAHPDWPGRWRAATGRMRRLLPGCRGVVAAYADWQRAQAPPPEVVCTFARLNRCDAFLLDTWRKDGRNLLNWLPAATIARLCRDCRESGVRVALAGSLGPRQIVELQAARPDWFAVRGAVCRGGRRDAAVDADAVRRLADLIAGLAVTPATPGS
jgi:uncharacterized protein (UPF0264 family)